MTAGERDASDRINRDRVPRQYQKAVKEYFSNVQRSIQGAKRTEADTDSSTTGADTASEPNEQTNGEDDKD